MYSGCTVSQFVDGEKQHCLSNLQAIIINTVVCILCQTQLFSEKRNAVTEFGYSRQPTNEARAESNLFELCLARRRKTKSVALSNVVLVIFFVVEGINDGVVKCVSRHLPPPFKETLKIRK